MSRSNKAPLLAVAAMIGAMSLLAACHTVEGVGQDVQSAGSAVSTTAEQTHDGNPNTP